MTMCMGKFSFSRKATSSSAYGKMSLSRSLIREEEGRGRKVKNEKLGERERESCKRKATD